MKNSESHSMTSRREAMKLIAAGSNLVVVKVETTEPGLYGLGCARRNYYKALIIYKI